MQKLQRVAVLPAALLALTGGACIDDLPLAWGLCLGAFLLAAWWAAATGGRPAMACMLLLAAGARLPATLQDPHTSDDVYRYLFEGSLLARGESPYHFPPDSPRFQDLRASRIYPHINNREIASIYPPVAQGLFLLGHQLGGTPAAWKLLLMACELLAAAWLWLRTPHGPLRATLLAWHPLLLIDSSDGGHVDAAGACLLLVALVSAVPRAGWTAAGSALASCLVKPVPGPLLLLFCRTRRALAAFATLGLGAVALLAWMLTPPGDGLYTPDEKGVARSADGRAEIRFEPDGARFVTRRPGALETSTSGVPEYGRVLGRYHFAVRGARAPHASLTFDAQEVVVLSAPSANVEQRLGFYVEQAGGDVVVFFRSTGAIFARLHMSADRVVMTGRVLLPFEDWPPGDALLLKGAESALLGSAQYFGRWQGFSPVHDLAVRLLGSRRALRIAVPLLLGALAVILFVLKCPLPAGALVLCTTAVLCVPVLYSWYLLWCLPGALLLRRVRSAFIATLLIAAAPLLHVL